MATFAVVWRFYFAGAILTFHCRSILCEISCLDNNGDICTTIYNTCYVRRKLISGNRVLTDRGCYNQELGLHEFCSKSDPDDKVHCCEEDECNSNMPPSVLLEFEIETERQVMPSPSPTLDPPTNSSELFEDLFEKEEKVMYIVLVPTLCSMGAVLLMLTCLCIIKQRMSCCHKSNSSCGTELPRTQNIDLANSSDSSLSSGSGSGLPLLIQQTMARSIKLGDVIGSGRFGSVHVGVYQNEKIAVKKFSSRDEASWSRESEIYNSVCLRHDNVLVFFASDMISNNGSTELWLITQYHAHGSLYDYLIGHALSIDTAIRMMLSLCRGISHLHTPIHGVTSKPSLAHRDVKSKNVLVKDNLECCIGDFGLSVIEGLFKYPTNPKQGSKRYMAPEILTGSINVTRFESLMEADVYALGLVLWEICSRSELGKDCVVADYEPPFHGHVPSDPSLEVMLHVVVEKGVQPSIPATWREDKLLGRLTDVMRECWYHNHQARPSAVAIKNKILDLRPLHSENKIC